MSISYTGTVNISKFGTNPLYSFTGNGTFTLPKGMEVKILIVGGGGGGGDGKYLNYKNSAGGSGGCGGTKIFTTKYLSSGTYTVNIGSGGLGGSKGTNGSNGGATTITYSNNGGITASAQGGIGGSSATNVIKGGISNCNSPVKGGYGYSINENLDGTYNYIMGSSGDWGSYELMPTPNPLTDNRFFLGPINTVDKVYFCPGGNGGGISFPNQYSPKAPGAGGNGGGNYYGKSQSPYPAQNGSTVVL